MRNIVIGLLILIVYGCGSSPAYPGFVGETRKEVARDLCNQYTWGQMTRSDKTLDPSPQEVCTQIYMCVQKAHCVLGLPHWHYKR